MWRKFFKIIAEDRDYLYKFCNIPYRKLHRFCIDWYMYNRKKTTL